MTAWEKRKIRQKGYLNMIIEQAEYLKTWNNNREILEELPAILDKLRSLSGMKYWDRTENEKCKAEIKAMHEEYDRNKNL